MGRTKRALKKKYEDGDLEVRKALFSFFTQGIPLMFFMMHLDRVEERAAFTR